LQAIDTKPQRDSVLLAKNKLQYTIGAPISFEGFGVFTSKSVSMTLYPAEAGFGIGFKRLDLEGCPIVKVCGENIGPVKRTVRLVSDKVEIICVEHLLSALNAFGIDNVLVEMDEKEVPILDGSSVEFFKALKKVGKVKQEEGLEYCLKQPLYIDDGKCQLIALPSDTFKISYTLSYPKEPLIGSQYFSSEITEKVYEKELASCRTFVLYKEVKLLVMTGLIKSKSLDSGVVINGEEVMTKDGLRFKDEMVRHKVLDLIGDLYLVGKRINAHFIGVKSGHNLNTQMAKMIGGLIGESE